MPALQAPHITDVRALVLGSGRHARPSTRRRGRHAATRQPGFPVRVAGIALAVTAFAVLAGAAEAAWGHSPAGTHLSVVDALPAPGPSASSLPGQVGPDQQRAELLRVRTVAATAHAHHRPKRIPHRHKHHPAAGRTFMATPVSPGSAQQIALEMMPSFGFSPATQFGCLDSMWTRESNWAWNADNTASGAYGIPQSLPAVKMASAGPDWRTNPTTQISWGLGYIKSRYGTPCAAWTFWQAHNWY